jgi:hypothetical protein
MSWVRIKGDTRITTPGWVIIPCAVIGWGGGAALCWVLLFERGERQIGLLIATVCLMLAGVIALHLCEKRERIDRAVFGGARFAADRSEAARAGLSGD